MHMFAVTKKRCVPLSGLRRAKGRSKTPMTTRSFSISVRCYAELNDRLPANRRQQPFSHTCPHKSRVNDLLRALNVPQDAVDLALVNGVSVDFLHPLSEGDRVSLYPVFESFDIGRLTKVRDGVLRKPSFILDVHLGKLAHLLRMLGFDTLYQNNYTDAVLMALSGREGRTLLSKDRALVEDEAVQRGMVIRSQHPRMQLLEVMNRFDLYREAHPFTRCIECNTPLTSVRKETIEERLPPVVRTQYEEFNRCVECGRVYWKGSHFVRMEAYAREILAAGGREL
jgi:uncharacterized protein